MKSKGVRALMVSASLLAFTDTRSDVLGKLGRAAAYETVQTAMPVATSYVLPTSYVIPTSYVLPTSYAYPTSYVGTSFAVPTAYEVAAYPATAYVVPTYYRTRRVLAPRRRAARPIYATTSSYYVPTTAYSPTSYYPSAYTPTSYYPSAYTPTSYYPSVYYPTTYVTPTYAATSYAYPTIYDAPIVATTASACCAETIVPRAPVTLPPQSVRPAPSQPSATPALESTPATKLPPPDSGANPATEPTTGTKSTARPPDSTNLAPSGRGPEAGNPQLPAPAAPASPLDDPAPLAPSDGPGTPPPPGLPAEPLPPAGSDAGIRREAQRPANYAVPVIRSARNILEGKVVSGDTGSTEEGVQLIIASRTNAFADRVTTTNAYGRYAIRLPDGDWTVNVVMPSGRTYPVSQITISGGQITDDLGRNVPSLTITR